MENKAGSPTRGPRSLQRVNAPQRYERRPTPAAAGHRRRQEALEDAVYATHDTPSRYARCARTKCKSEQSQLNDQQF